MINYNLLPEVVPVQLFIGTRFEDTYTVRSTVTGEPLDLTAYTHRVSMKRSADDIEALLDLGIDLTHAAEGIVMVYLTPEAQVAAQIEPGDYVLDHLCTSDNDGGTVARWVLTFVQPVTRRVG